MDTAQDPQMTPRRPPDRLPFRSCGDKDATPPPTVRVPLLDAEDSVFNTPSFLPGCLQITVLVGDPQPLTRPLQPGSGARFLQRGCCRNPRRKQLRGPSQRRAPPSRPPRLGCPGRTQPHFLGSSVCGAAGAASGGRATRTVFPGRPLQSPRSLSGPRHPPDLNRPELPAEAPCPPR